MDDQRELEFELTRVALETLSPEEAAVLEVLGPDALGDSRADGALGFGLEAATWTGMAVVVSQGVAAFLIGTAHEYAVDEGKHRLRKLIERIRNRSLPDVLTADELQRVREAAEERARASGLDPERAMLLADAIVGAMSRPPPEKAVE